MESVSAEPQVLGSAAVEAASGIRGILHQEVSRPLLGRLWAALPGNAVATAFQRPDVLDALNRHVAATAGAQMRLLEVRDAATGRTRMLVPLMVTRRGPLRIGGMPDFDLADLCAPVLASEAPFQPFEGGAVWSLIDEALQDVDLIRFAKMPPRISGFPNPLFHVLRQPEAEPTYVLDLEGGYGAGGWRKRSVYKEARGKYRKLQAEGVSFVQADGVAQKAAFLRELRRQRAQRFAEKGWANLLEQDASQGRYYDDLLEGPVEVFALQAQDGEIAGAICVLCHNSMVSATLISMGDGKWRRFSPGLVLFAKLIEWAEASGYNELCFGAGVQFYKQRFGGDPVETLSFERALTAAGSAYLALRRLKRIARRLRSERRLLTAAEE
ncbi:GNAT family N-acetyltransferase [Pannonibacter indicus]|uniref:Acetyltransferase involved in cellulose biosynthesis, CelD/BcsL family n=1 Tax=Pannonibacter indicus TaxID=466044 RepID=A0A0K6HUK0_9HYPH|nr:GNAT family N-acetyltransferase [Pannonibacter indicus]CUA94531.1 Acetyltransferase involved in cellulose biosynthesis, CelD/BcsL family [Pannonibacter indicus]